MHDILQAINEQNGAAADYQSFVSTLRSLYSCTNTIKGALEQTLRNASSLRLEEQPFVNGVIHEIRCCKRLDEFLQSTYKYTAQLLPPSQARKFEAQGNMSFFNKLRFGKAESNKTWRKIFWAVFRKEDIEKLERDLHGHLAALGTYRIFLQQ